MDAKTVFVAQVKAMPGNVVTVKGLTVTVVSPDLVTFNKVNDLLQETPWLAVFGSDSKELTHGARFIK